MEELEQKIESNLEAEDKARELVRLLKSYNAFSMLLFRAKNGNSSNMHRESDLICYKDQFKDLFSLFKNDEYLINKVLHKNDETDILFLIDYSTILKINYYGNYNYNDGNTILHYELINIDNCKAKINIENVYCGDPYYFDYHSEKKYAFGFYDGNRLITPTYALNNQTKDYDGKDIREILQVQSLDEIYEKLTTVKDEKIQSLLAIINPMNYIQNSTYNQEHVETENACATLQRVKRK